MKSPAATLAAMPAEEREAYLDGLSPADLEQLLHTWKFWARPDQLPPEGEWRTWVLLGGRGSGKTRSASETVHTWVEEERRRNIGIVSPTMDTTRRICVEGLSGILATAKPWSRPTYEPALRRLVWPNGATAYLFSSEEPDRLRGPNLDGCWVDELCAFANPDEVWNMLQMCVRVPGPKGDPPQIIVTTTPRPINILRTILAAESTRITKARTLDNAANLDESTVQHLLKTYGGTTLGRQELDAEVLDSVDGALWTRSMIDNTRVTRPPPMQRIVVAIDPSIARKGDGDECGLCVAGKAYGQDGHCYILQDASLRGSPETWARRACNLYREWKADRMISESNQGGDMVRLTLRTADPTIGVKLIHASKGKQSRAEPIAALWEQGRCHIVNTMPALEDELTGWAPMDGGPSPNRLDAMVYAASELMLRKPIEQSRPTAPNVIALYQR